MRTLANERQLSAQYVDELVKFIDASFAENAANSSGPRILPPSLRNVVAVFCDRHGTELEYDDLALIAAMSTLPEEHGPRRVEFYDQCDRQKQRYRCQKANAGNGIVHQLLNYESPPGDRPYAYLHEVDSPDTINTVDREVERVIARAQPDVDGKHAQFVQKHGQLLVGQVGRSNDQFVDLLTSHNQIRQRCP